MGTTADGEMNGWGVSYPFDSLSAVVQTSGMVTTADKGTHGS